MISESNKLVPIAGGSLGWGGLNTKNANKFIGSNFASAMSGMSDIDGVLTSRDGLLAMGSAFDIYSTEEATDPTESSGTYAWVIPDALKTKKVVIRLWGTSNMRVEFRQLDVDGKPTSSTVGVAYDEDNEQIYTSDPNVLGDRWWSTCLTLPSNPTEYGYCLYAQGGYTCAHTGATDTLIYDGTWSVDTNKTLKRMVWVASVVAPSSSPHRMRVVRGPQTLLSGQIFEGTESYEVCIQLYSNLAHNLTGRTLWVDGATYGVEIIKNAQIGDLQYATVFPKPPLLSGSVKNCWIEDAFFVAGSYLSTGGKYWLQMSSAGMGVKSYTGSFFDAATRSMRNLIGGDGTTYITPAVSEYNTTRYTWPAATFVGLSITAISGICWHKNHLALSGITVGGNAYTTRVYFSTPSAVSSFSGFGANRYLEFEADVLSMASDGSYLYVLAGDSLWVVSGDTYDTSATSPFQQVVVIPDMWVIDPTIVPTPYGMIIVGQTNLYVVNGAQYETVSIPLGASENLSNASFTYSRKDDSIYICQFVYSATATDYTTTVWRINLSDKKWYKTSYGGSAAKNLSVKSILPVDLPGEQCVTMVSTGSPTVSTVYRQKPGTLTDAVAPTSINAYYRTGPKYLSDGDKCILKNLWVTVGNADTSITTTVYRDFETSAIAANTATTSIYDATKSLRTPRRIRIEIVGEASVVEVQVAGAGLEIAEIVVECEPIQSGVTT